MSPWKIDAVLVIKILLVILVPQEGQLHGEKLLNQKTVIVSVFVGPIDKREVNPVWNDGRR